MAGDLWVPEGLAAESRLPGILLVHGWGGLKSHLNQAYAPQFAQEGYVVLTFDYRGWGQSDGKYVRAGKKPEADGEILLKVREVREIVDPLDQLEDIRNALAFLSGEPQVDASKLAIWGSSLGGGLALQTAAQFPAIKVLISQIGAVDNLANFQARGQTTPAQRNAWQNQIRRVRGDLPPFPEASETVSGLRGAPDYNSLMRYDPMQWAGELNAATLIIDAAAEDLFDTSKNGRALYDAIKGKMPASYHELPGKHYDIYRGDAYREALALQIAWLKQHLH
jgi:hypothetical protein